ncbi:MAG TPA: AAA family ATPase [Proteobacteria bacterium]|nr:AAA family ATPase [Pseudomonadota bacterium]
MIPNIIRQASAFTLSRPIETYARFLLAEIDIKEPLIGLKGARGSGKTTLMRQYARRSGLPAEKILYVSCDHPAMAGVNLYDLAQGFFQEGGKLLLLDEIHKLRGFAGHLKAIRDTFALQVFFSGSSAIRLDHESADLSRRVAMYRLPALSFREFLEIETASTFAVVTLADLVKNHLAFSMEIAARIRPIEYFLQYIKYGAYPFYLESIENYPAKLLEMINLTIESDLPALFNIEASKLDKLKKLLYMLCSTPPVELNKTKLSTAIGTSWPTVSKYLSLMAKASLLHQIRGAIGMRTVNKPDKLLLHNPNLFQVLCADPDIGSLRESFFVSQLSYKHQTHYHDRADFMVDDTLVFEVGGSGKTGRQIKGLDSAYIVRDDMEVGAPKEIPLWSFGFLY